MQSILDRHDRLACHAVLMTATSKLDEMVQDASAVTQQSPVPTNVSGLPQSISPSNGILHGMGLSSSDVELAQRQKDGQSFTNALDFTQQEMAEAVARRQGADATAYQRLYQFAFTCREHR